MVEHRNQIVERVVQALAETHDPDRLVWRYFDEDRNVVVEAARQTLEATREVHTLEKVEAIVDQEMIEALRFPDHLPIGALRALYLHRGVATVTTAIATLGALLALLVL